MTSKIAIIVEWDNARLSEVDRAREMLRRVSGQAAAAARTTNAQFDLILIFDPETIDDRASYARPWATASGIRWVLVNGRVAVDHGRLTGVRAGRVLRRASAR